VHLSNQFVEALISLKIKKIAVFRAAPFAKRAAFCLTPSCAGWRILPHGGRKTRLEIEFANDKAVQVYDGANGWKLRPFLGRRVVEPLSADEMKATSMESDLDGPLVDYSTKGTRVDLEGVEKVEGHDAYKLKLTMKGGQVRHLWVDAQTFLEVKIEGIPRRMDGKMHPVEIYYRDYKSVSGLIVPYVLETTVQGVKQSHKMTVESVVVNPKLEDSLFAAPKTK
jgi:outer membrane lipoprotein-sorting protein